MPLTKRIPWQDLWNSECFINVQGHYDYFESGSCEAIRKDTISECEWLNNYHNAVMNILFESKILKWEGAVELQGLLDEEDGVNVLAWFLVY